MSVPEKPVTRKEKFYDGILTRNAVPTPITREEMYLAEIAENGGAGGSNVNLSNYYTKSQTDSLISKKVDKVDYMGLSENNFTDAEKSKLSELENYDDTEIKTEITKVNEQTAINRSTLGYQSKNLLKNTANTATLNGVTFTINDDGSVTADGTATALCTFTISNVSADLQGKTLLLSGCPTGGNYQTGYALIIDKASDSRTVGYDTGNGAKIAVPDEACRVRIVIRNGVTVSNLIFKPMLRYAEITDDTYEPYKPSIDDRIASLEARINALETKNQTNTIQEENL